MKATHRDGFRFAALLGSLLLAMALVACGRSNSDAAQADQATAGPAGMEVAQAEKAFASAKPSLRFPVEDTLRVVKAGGYADALPGLRKLAANPSPTPEQKQALQALIQKLEVLATQGTAR